MALARPISQVVKIEEDGRWKRGWGSCIYRKIADYQASIARASVMTAVNPRLYVLVETLQPADSTLKDDRAT